MNEQQRKSESHHRLQYGGCSSKLGNIRRICFTSLVLLCMVGLFFRRPIILKSQLLWFEYRCLNYSDQTDVPVYAQVYLPDFPKLLKEFPTLRPLEEVLPTRAGRIVQDLQSLSQRRLNVQRINPEATVFVGKLKSIHGELRLVAVELSQNYPELESVGSMGGAQPGCPIVFQLDSSRPAGIFTPGGCHVRTFAQVGPVGNLSPFVNFTGSYQDTKLGIRIYPGHVDPLDESRFVSKVTMGKHNGKLTGVLQVDGSIKLKLEGFESFERKF